MILVCSYCEYDMQFIVGADKKVVIYGKHSGGRTNQQTIILPFGKTMVDDVEWAEICERYKEVAQIKNGLIFAEKKNRDTEYRAQENANNQHATGANQATLNNMDHRSSVSQGKAFIQNA